MKFKFKLEKYIYNPLTSNHIKSIYAVFITMGDVSFIFNLNDGSKILITPNRS